jgi:prepilin-type N-terminal cleavage/methylation domain-containing protein
MQPVHNLTVRSRKQGFTLIELLIVVAIIAILAAIAIPNFLAAQTRSKVARIRAEFNSLGTAIEAYSVDENTYPIHKSPSGQNGVFGQDDYGSFRFDVLTTPVAYISSIPKDPFYFSGHGAIVGYGIGYFMYTWDKFRTPADLSGGPFHDIYHASYWSLWSCGPYGKFVVGSAINANGIYPYQDDPPKNTEGDCHLIAYDPTNGTVSAGGVYRTSKQGSI